MNDVLEDFKTYFDELLLKESLKKNFNRIDSSELFKITQRLVNIWITSTPDEEKVKTSMKDFFYLQVVVGLIKFNYQDIIIEKLTIENLIFKMLEEYFEMDSKTESERKIHDKIMFYLHSCRLENREKLKSEYYSDKTLHQKSILTDLNQKLCEKYVLENETRLNKTYLEYGFSSLIFNCCETYFREYNSQIKTQKFGSEGELSEPEGVDCELEHRLYMLIILLLPYDDREIFLLKYRLNMKYKQMASTLKLIGTRDFTTDDVLRVMCNQIKTNKIIPLKNIFYNDLPPLIREHINGKFIGDNVFKNNFKEQNATEYLASECFYSSFNKEVTYLKVNNSQFYFQIMNFADEQIFTWFILWRYPKFSKEERMDLLRSFFKLTKQERAVIIIEILYSHSLENLEYHCIENSEVLKSLMPDISKEQILSFVNSLNSLKDYRQKALAQWQIIH